MACILEESRATDCSPGTRYQALLKTNLSQLAQAINLMLETTGSNPSCSISFVRVLAGVACLDLGSDLRGTVVSSGHEGDQGRLEVLSTRVPWLTCTTLWHLFSWCYTFEDTS